MAKDKNMNNNSQDNEIKVINANPETAPEKETPEVNLSTVQPEPQPPVYEDYESHEVARKPKKRFKKRYLVIVAAVIALGVFGYAKYNASKNVVVFVETKETTLGTIENILSISGTVQSAETKTYFSKVAAPISEVSVKVGDKVSAGDTLITYDTESLELSEKTAELAIKQAKNSYGANFTGTAAAEREYAKGMNAQQINARLDAITAEIDAIKRMRTARTNTLNQTLTDLNKVLLDYNENGVSDVAEGYDPYSRKDSDGKELYLQTQQAKLDISNQLQSDAQLLAWDQQIIALQEEQSHLTSAKSALLNSSSVAAAKAQLESTQLSQEDTIEKLEVAKEGIKADFNGVVTAISAVEGATATNGAQLLTIANTDDVQVAIQISKSDLPKISIGQKVDITINGKPYDGEISKISGTATKNNNGVAVVETIIKVKNPDSDIILGVEASNKIHAQKAENTLVLPYEYILTDSEGDYVYVVEDGVVVRRNVSLGITSSTEAQIVDGLTAGESIITSDTENLAEGTPVAITE